MAPNNNVMVVRAVFMFTCAESVVSGHLRGAHEMYLLRLELKQANDDANHAAGGGDRAGKGHRGRVPADGDCVQSDEQDELHENAEPQEPIEISESAGATWPHGEQQL